MGNHSNSDGKSNSTELLDKLAEQILVRHIQKCISNDILRNWEDLPATLRKAQRQSHVIAVVGAGASAPVLARGDDLVDKLKKAFGIDHKLHERKLRRLEKVSRLNPNDLETQLVALSDTHENEL